MATATDILTQQAPPATSQQGTQPNGAAPVVPPGGMPPAAGWWDTFSNPDVKAWAANKKYESPEMLASSAYSMERMVGADKAGRTVVLPKDDADAEGMKAFRAKMGVPETADGYKLPLPVGDDGKFAKTASTWFHEAGLAPKAAEFIASKWNDFMGAEVKAAEAAEILASQQKVDALKVEWGPKFDERSEMARRGLRGIGTEAGFDDADLKRLEASIGADKMVKLFWRIGEVSKEGAFAGKDGNAATFGITPTAAQERMNAIVADRSAGKINDYQWRTESEPEMDRLLKVLTNGERAA